MAALQPIQKDKLGPYQRAYTSRALLPFEVDLCKTLGLTREDYFYFCQLAETKAKERPEEYAHIPDVENATVIAVVSLVVGLIATAVSLSAPKPKAPDDPRNLKTADIKGQSKFAQYFSFDSLQELANLGEIIPLVFANRNTEKGIGGVRTKALLIWSQMLSTGTQQELKALFTAGLGIIPAPDIEGFALGDQLLETYNRNKYSLYWRPDGGRIDETDNRYTGPTMYGQGYEDVYLAQDDWVPTRYSPLFSGTRTPSSETEFGVSQTKNNGCPFYFGYQLILRKNRDSHTQAEKNKRPYASRQAFVLHNNQNVINQTLQLEVNDPIDYLISAGSYKEDGYAPFGLTDVINAVDDRRFDTDDQFHIGESFLAGTAYVECTGISTSEPWIPGTAKSYQFVVRDRGILSFWNPDADGLAAFSYTNAAYGFHISRASFGVVTNNRSCDQTEIGIRSNVWKRLNNWANVNSEPDPEVIEDYEDSDSDTLQLGTVNRYINRWSFFKLYYRPVQAPFETPWSEISFGTFFGVSGNTPTDLYNFIRISHPHGQYEFRFAPVPGAEALDSLGSEFIQLDGVYRGMNPELARDGIYLCYSGRRIALTDKAIQNRDFAKYGRNPQLGKVVDVTPKTVGVLPADAVWELVQTAIDYDAATRIFQYAVVIDTRNQSIVKAFWDGIEVAVGGEYQKGAYYATILAAVTNDDWVQNDGDYLNLSGGYYYEVDAAGTFIQAIWNSVLVSGETQQTTALNPSAQYRRAGQYTTAQSDSTYQFESTVYVPTSPEQGAFGVWHVVGQPEATRRAFWNGTEVPLNTDTILDGGEIGRYVVGVLGGYFASINCDVYYISREVKVPGQQTRYFYSIERGYYSATLPSLDVYYIGKYEFDSENVPFVYPPAGYVVDSTRGLTVNASSFAQGQWQWLVVNGGSGFAQGEIVQMSFPDGTKVPLTLNVDTSEPEEVELFQLNTHDALNDWHKYDEEESSHDRGPEHAVVYVNEQLRNETPPQYDGLALVGLRMRAGRDWTSLGQLTAYCRKGMNVDRLIDDNGNPVTGLQGPTNLLPEIAYNLLTSKEYGAGARLSADSVDREAMTEAARFCLANGFHWDGMIGNRIGLREWIFEQAAYCMLNFTIIGGRFALTPAVTFNSSTGVVDPSVPVTISALFTDGNMRDMLVTMLPPEERQMFTAQMTYREEVENGFSINKTFTVRLSDSSGGSALDPVEGFDLVTFCTNRHQAETFAQYALLLRKNVDHTIEFQTTPASAAALFPGSYIKVVSEASHTDRFSNGSIDSAGYVTGTTAPQDGTFSFYYWRPGETEIREGTTPLTNGQVLDEQYWGVVFAVITQSTTARVYQVEALSIGDDGFVQVTGTHQPLTASGCLEVVQFTYDSFEVEG